MSSLTFRLLDANLNRASEGLRVLEDISRFILDDESYTFACRRARHDLARIAMCYDVRLLSGRDTAGDRGRDAPSAAGENPRDMVAVVRANAKRVEESLRVLEEVARGTDAIGTDAAAIERIRYSTYELERGIAARLLRRDRIGLVTGLYVIIDRQFALGRAPVDVASKAIDGGARVIQLRDKLQDRRDVYRDALEMRDLCSERDVLFVVNDHVDVAAATEAPAVHVGQGDLPIEAVRRVVPMTTIVGVSCHSMNDVRRALDEGADYIAVGSVFPTSQKDGATVVGLDLVRGARQLAVHVPLVAIGGIEPANVAGVMGAGADAVAVIGAVAGQADAAGAARALCAAMRTQPVTELNDE